MRSNPLVPRLAALVLGLSLAAACGDDAKDASPRQAIPPGNISGRILISEGVPAQDCLVLVEGTPLSGRCDSEGNYSIQKVPPGPWDVVVLPDNDSDSLPRARLRVGVNSGIWTHLGETRLATPGAIAGRVQPQDAEAGGKLSTAVVLAPALGIVTLPTPEGAFLLEGVAPGERGVELLWEGGSESTVVKVEPRTTVRDVNFALRGGAASTGTAVLEGTLAYAGEGTPALKLEVFNQRKNAFEARHSRTVTAPASWRIDDLEPGFYTLRASVNGNPPFATHPLVVLRAGETKALPAPLVVLPNEGDLDGDGVADEADADRDGDGHTQAQDAFPDDPAEWRDSDEDGLGDRADLFLPSEGQQPGTPKRRTPTDDLDGDSWLDFEDNCADLSNPDQADGDGDSVGDRCDSCPGRDDKDPACDAPYALGLDLGGAGATLDAGVCSAPVTVQLRGNALQPMTTSRVRAIGLRASSDELEFFDSADCSGPAVTLLTLPAGTHQRTFSFRNIRAGTQRVEAFSQGLIESGVDITVRPGVAEGLGFTSRAHSVQAGVCAGFVEVGTVDRYGNAATSATGFQVRLEQPDTTSFYLDDICTQAIPTGAQGQTLDVAAGGSTARFYFKRGTAGDFTISARKVGSTLEPAKQTQTIRPSEPTGYRFINPVLEQTLPLGTCSAVMQVVQVDEFGNVRPWTKEPVLRISGVSSAELFSDPLCTTRLRSEGLGVFSTPVERGTQVVSFYATTRKKENLTLTPYVSSFTQAKNSYRLNFVDIPAARIDLSQGDTLARAGSCITRAFRIERFDTFGNATAEGTTAIDLEGAGLVFHALNTCGSSTPRVSIVPGSTFVQFYVSVPATTAPGPVTVTARSGSLAPVSASLSIITPLAGLSVRLGDADGVVESTACTPLEVSVLGPTARERDVSLSFPGTLSVSTSPTCNTPVSSHVFRPGDTPLVLYVFQRTVGTHSVTVRGTVSSPQAQTLHTVEAPAAQLTVIPGRASSLSLSGGGPATISTTSPAGACSAMYTVSVRDVHANAVPAARSLTVSSPGGAFFYRTKDDCDTAERTESRTGDTLLPLEVSASTGSVTFYARATAPVTQTVTVRSAGLSDVSSSWSITAGPAKRIGLLNRPETLSNGQCNPLTWVLTDAFGNVASLPGQASLAWEFPNPTFPQGSEPVVSVLCGQPTANPMVPANTSSGTLHLRPAVTGTLSFVVKVGNITSASYPFRVE